MGKRRRRFDRWVDSSRFAERFRDPAKRFPPLCILALRELAQRTKGPPSIHLHLPLPL
jgi:hypothetical protein